MSCKVAFGGAEMELLGEGLLWVPEWRLLCGSDLHFEKGSFFQRFATFLPPYDTQATLLKLAAVFEARRPDIFVSLGDSFHDVQGLARMRPEDAALLDGLIGSVREWIWIEGNHDPVIATSVGGRRCETYRHQDVAFRHILEPASDDWEISGHFHPKTRVSVRGHTMRGPCFVQAGRRLVMPAFGSYTGGLSVDHPELLQYMPAERRRLYLLHDSRVFSL